VRHDRPRRLLAVPRTLTPQALRERLQIDERSREAVGRHYFDDVAAAVVPAAPVEALPTAAAGP